VLDARHDDSELLTSQLGKREDDEIEAAAVLEEGGRAGFLVRSDRDATEEVDLVGEVGPRRQAQGNRKGTSLGGRRPDGGGAHALRKYPLRTHSISA